MYLYFLGSLIGLARILTIHWPGERPGVDITGHALGRDFMIFWSAPQLALSGQFGVLFNVEAYNRAIHELFGQVVAPYMGFSYPLHAILIYAPFSTTPYFVGLFLWTSIFLIMLFACAASQIRREDWPVLALLVALAPASIINIVGGQNGFLSGVLLLGGVLLVPRHQILAGVMFGLLTYKPHLGLLVPVVLVARRAWKTMFVAAVTSSLLIGVSVELFGLEAWRSSFVYSREFSSWLLGNFQGFYMAVMVSPTAALRAFGVATPTALTIQALITAALGLTIYRAVRRTDDPCRHAILLATGAPLATPYAFNYDLPAASVCLAWIFLGRLEFNQKDRIIYLLAWISPLAGMIAGFGIWQPAIALTPLALLALYVSAARDTRKSEETPDPILALP